MAVATSLLGFVSHWRSDYTDTYDMDREKHCSHRLLGPGQG